MVRQTPEFEDLTAEQQRFQFDPSGSTHRDRTLAEYAGRFGFLRKQTFLNLVSTPLSSTDQTVFADFGCGEGIALKEFLQFAEKRGQKNQVRVIGIDLIDLEGNEQNQNIEFMQDDIETVTLPSPVDLATLCDVLLWTRNPLAALANAAAQTKRGGLICANWLERVRNVQTLEILSADLSGFEIVASTKDKSGLALRKNNSVTDPEELLKDWFGNIPKLERRTYFGPQLGHHFFYSL